MIRALTIITAVIALAVSAAPIASAGAAKKPPTRGYSMSSGGDRPTESLSMKAGSPKPRSGVVVTKATDISSTKLQRSAPKPPGLGNRAGG